MREAEKHLYRLEIRPHCSGTTFIEKSPLQRDDAPPSLPRRPEPDTSDRESIMKHSIKTLRPAFPQITYPSHLPIFEKRDVIVKAIKEHQVLVITGETGSGKSTQIPKMCLEAGRGIFGKIGITQPRRVAATSIAGQIARELKDQVGKAVGYKIRFQNKTSPHTYIKVMTDGILLAETQSDRHLNQYDTIIIDEAHERNLNIDFLLGILRQLLKKRKDLKLIITSATIDTEKFSKAFNNA
ncbi:MAG: DEAD/DEAH box helicase, partial [Deltaproteobacteria bacterium]|nr:DEAD/DEAH box helicase [Deltaproteobacteria bacterium]